MKDIKVKDIMIRSVFKCKSTDTVFKVAKSMKKNNIGSMVIVKGKTPVGIVTREDIIKKIVVEEKDPKMVTANNIMSSPIITCGPEDNISEVCKLMNKHGFERIPIKYINALIGIVTIRDILRVAPGLIDMFQEHFEKEEELDYGGPKIDLMTSGDCELCGNTGSLKEVNAKWVCDSCNEEASEL